MQMASSIVLTPRERGLNVLLQAAIIATFACILAGCASGLAMYLGSALPSTLFDALQSWIPHNYYWTMESQTFPQTLQSWSVQPRFHHFDFVLGHRVLGLDFSSVCSNWTSTTEYSSRSWINYKPVSMDEIWELAQPLSVLAFIMQLLALCLTSFWFRWIGWPVSWRGVDPARRRAALAQAWWLSTLGLIVVLPVVQLTWVMFVRVGAASGRNFGLALDTGDIEMVLYVLSIPVLVFLITAYVLQRVIRCTAHESDRHCMRCDDRMKAPMPATCPECGLVEAQPFAVSPAWLRVFAARGASRWVELLWVAPLLMLMAPLIMPQLQVLCRVVSRLF